MWSGDARLVLLTCLWVSFESKRLVYSAVYAVIKLLPRSLSFIVVIFWVSPLAVWSVILLIRRSALSFCLIEVTKVLGPWKSLFSYCTTKLASGSAPTITLFFESISSCNLTIASLSNLFLRLLSSTCSYKNVLSCSKASDLDFQYLTFSFSSAFSASIWTYSPLSRFIVALSA